MTTVSPANLFAMKSRVNFGKFGVRNTVGRRLPKTASAAVQRMREQFWPIRNVLFGWFAWRISKRQLIYG